MAVIAFSTLYQRADFFDFNLKCLLYTGLWSEEDWSDDKKKLYQIYNTSLFALAFIYVLITGIGAYASRDDVIVLLINLDKAIAAYNYIFKIIMFSFKRNHIRILISEIIYSGDHITKERKKIMGYQVVLISAMITSIIGGFQVVGQINGEMPVDAWLPFDPLKNMFSLFLAGQILGALFMIPFMYRAISIQGIVCSIIMYLCDQLVELQQRLKALNYTTERETVVRKEFKEIIKKHIRMMGIILHYIRNTMAVIAFSTLYQRADFFDFNLKCLLYTGLWSEEDWSDDKKKLYQIYNTSLFALAFIYVLITGIGAYASRDDVIVLLINLDKAIAAYNYIFKIIMFSFKRNHIRILISEIIYSGDHITKERKKIMGYQVVLISAMITSIIGGFQVVGQINGEMPVDAWLPFDPLKNMFSLFLAGQILGALFMIPFMYRAISIQGIVCSIIMYLCDQLVELQQRLKALNYTTERETVVRKEFKEIIKKHIRMMGYSKSLKDAFKEYFLVQNLAVTMELGLNALMVTFIGLEQKKVLVTFMAFLIVALFNAYIFCHLGNELMDQSFGMALAAYETNWTSWPVDMQKDLLVVITASQKSFKLTAGGIAYMSMQTYAQALYNGYSMFAVLRDVVN